MPDICLFTWYKGLEYELPPVIFGPFNVKTTGSAISNCPLGSHKHIYGSYNLLFSTQ